MPPSKRKEIRVIKVPLRDPPLNRPQIFPRMPRLYLELIENKQKIHQDLINKEYVPTANANQSSYNIDNDFNKYMSSSGDKKSDTSRNNRLDMLLSDDDSTISTKKSDKLSVSSSVSELSIDEKYKKSSKYSDKDSDYDKYSDKDSDYDDKYDNKYDDKLKDVDKMSDESENLSLRLKDLLNDDSDYDKNSRHKSIASDDKYSRHRDFNGHSVPQPQSPQQYISQQPQHSVAPPTLAELEKQGGYIPKNELRDINQVNHNEQQEEDAKRELLFKFDLLRKSYPASTIPEYTIHTEYQTMEKAYNDTVRRLSLDSSVESYKTYLVYGFMGCEFVFGNFLGFDMQGFTQQQIISMSSYEKLLIEIGEKSYVPEGSKWPVELRLLFMIIMNAAFFVVSKMMMKKTGANLMGMINNMNSSSKPANVPSGAQKRRMRGPNIDIDDIPEVQTPGN